jgi:hypothetical protein
MGAKSLIILFALSSLKRNIVGALATLLPGVAAPRPGFPSEAAKLHCGKRLAQAEAGGDASAG